ncbi:MAG: hypothetical protein GY754_22830 [bacterium]|nr:hypothetical protein [bacterium]
MNKKIVSLCIMLFSLLFVACGSDLYDTPDGWFVKHGAPAGGDGKSWESAFNHPQDAMNAASAGEKIRVAAGTYSPQSNSDTVLLTMKEDVFIYGGFSGSSYSENDRNPARNVTILDGKSQVYHVVRGAHRGIIDGFTITGGNANGEDDNASGGGMFNKDCVVYILNCTFTGNQANSDGGALYNSGSNEKAAYGETYSSLNPGFTYNFPENVVVDYCTFTGNSGSRGGAIYNSNSDSNILNCSISGNSASLAGGGIYNINTSHSMIGNVTISGNTSAGDGGGISLEEDCDPVLANCLFYGNRAEAAGSMGGGMKIKNESRPLILNCTFYNNTADLGGAMGIDFTYTVTEPRSGIRSKIIISGSIFWNNNATVTTIDKEIYFASPQTVKWEISNNCIEIPGGDPLAADTEETEAVMNINEDPYFVDAGNLDYHLQHTETGHGNNSSCINGGSTEYTLFISMIMSNYTTRTDGVKDTDMVDMGYHYL